MNAVYSKCVIAYLMLVFIFMISGVSANLNEEATFINEKDYDKDYQIIDTHYINFELPLEVTHYWVSEGLDKYEVIIENLNIKGYINKTLKITWEDERYINEIIRINYTVKDGILTKQNIIPYSISKNSKLKFLNFQVELAEGFIEEIEKKELINESNLKKEYISIIRKKYVWSDWKDVDLVKINPLASSLSYTAIDDIEVGVCGTLDQENETYILNQSASTDGTCFTITANNVTLDCQGNNIVYSNDGSNNEYGVYSTMNNTNIKNCIVDDGNWTTTQADRFGIYFNGVENGTLENNIVNISQRRGIYLSSSSNYNTLTNNIGTSGTNGGIYLSSSSNYNTLTNNIGTSGTNGGIYLSSSSNYNTLTNNIGTSGTYGGIYLSSSSNNTLTSNTGTSLINDRPFRLYASSENILISNIADYYKIELESITYFYGLINSLMYDSSNSLCNGSSSDISLNDGHLNITIGVGGDCFVLDDFSVTQDVSRTNSPIAITQKTSKSLHITNSLSEKLDGLSVTFEMGRCSEVGRITYTSDTGDTQSFTDSQFTCVGDMVTIELNNIDPSMTSNYLEWTYGCSSTDRTLYNLILIAGALLILSFVAYYLFKNGELNEMTIGALVILFVGIIIGINLLGGSADIIAQTCVP